MRYYIWVKNKTDKVFTKKPKLCKTYQEVEDAWAHAPADCSLVVGTQEYLVKQYKIDYRIFPQEKPKNDWEIL